MPFDWPMEIFGPFFSFVHCRHFWLNFYLPIRKFVSKMYVWPSKNVRNRRKTFYYWMDWIPKSVTIEKSEISKPDLIVIVWIINWIVQLIDCCFLLRFSKQNKTFGLIGVLGVGKGGGGGGGEGGRMENVEKRQRKGSLQFQLDVPLHSIHANRIQRRKETKNKRLEWKWKMIEWKWKWKWIVWMKSFWFNNIWHWSSSNTKKKIMLKCKNLQAFPFSMFHFVYLKMILFLFVFILFFIIFFFFFFINWMN